MGLKIQRRATTKARIITTVIAVMALFAQPSYSFVAGQVANAMTGNVLYVSEYNGNDSSTDCRDAARCKTLDRAIALAHDGDTIKLIGNLNVSHQVTINKLITIDGKGTSGSYISMVYANFDKTGTDNNAVFGLQAAATIQNIRISGKNHAVHGINAWHTNGTATLSNVSLANNGQSGLNVGEQASVQATDISTANNGWSGIDVDKVGAHLTISGTSQHTEATEAIKVDDKTLGMVTDSNSQYGSVESSYVENGVTKVAVLYNLKLAAPTVDYPADNARINTNDFWFKWNSVDGAKSYEWQGSNVSKTTNVDGSLTNVIWSGDKDKQQPTASTLHSQGASGTWYWQVRAVDNLGVKGQWSPVWTMTIDKTAPAAPTNLSWLSTQNTSAAHGSTNVQTGTLSWDDTTPEDVDHYIYKFWTNIPGYQDDASNPWFTDNDQYIVKTATGGWVGTDFADKPGAYTFCVAAVDQAGNTSSCSQLTVTYDIVAPIVSIDQPNAVSASTSVTLTGHVDGTQAALALYRNGAWVDTITDIYANNNWSYTVPADDVAKGTYTYSVVATDAAGNESTVTSQPGSQTTLTVSAYQSVNQPKVEPLSVGKPGVSLTNPNSSFGRAALATPVADPPVVLGTQTANDDSSSSVLGSTNKDVAAIAPSSQGWKIFGVAWYWLLLAIATVGAGIWWIAAVARRRSQNV